MFLQPPHQVCQEHPGRFWMMPEASVPAPKTRSLRPPNRKKTWPDSAVLPALPLLSDS